MRKTQRLLSVAAIAATAISLAACSNGEQASSGGGSDTSAASSGSGGSSAAAGGSGVTTAKDVFGPGCSKVPTSGPGSVKGMVSDPVGTAASNNPLLKTTAKAVKVAGLVDTLNDTSKQYTVFAPANSAYEQPDTAPAVPGLLKNKQKLAGVLTYHVLPQRLDAKSLEQAGTEKPLAGGELTIKGSGDNMTVTDGAGRTAKVLCGNVPTANATVFVIDKVLMQKKAS